MSAADDQGTIETGDGPWTREALRLRISTIAPGIVLVRDVPRGSAESWDFMSRIVRDLGSEFDHYVILVDLTDAVGRPKGAHWEKLKTTFGTLLTPVHVAVIQPGSAVLRQVLRFILNSLDVETSVHGSLEEALSAARSKLAEAEGRAG